MKKQLRVAILGQGRSGLQIHAHEMLLLPRLFKVVAAVDPLKERRDRAAAEMGCDVYEDHRPVLERDDLDLVINATPSYLHAPVTLELLQAGHNVVVEKPLAKTVKQVDQLIAAAKKSGKLFTIYQQSRFAPYFLVARKVLNSGALGRVTQITISCSGFSRRWDWQTLTEFDGGNLLNTGPHPLDQALCFLDLPLDQVPQVACRMDNTHFFGDAEGHVNLMLRAPDRPVVTIDICSDNPYPAPLYNFCGTRGGLRGTTREIEWRWFNPASAPRRRLIRAPIVNAQGLPAYCESENLNWVVRKWTVPKSQTDLFKTIGTRYYRHLHKHLTQGGPLEVKPEQIRQQIAIIEECHRQNPHIWAKKPARKRAGKR